MALSLKLDVKHLFFDRKVVIDAMDAVTRRSLSKIGAFIMTNAKRRQRKRKRKVSDPGQSPFAHSASRQGLRFILFAFDPLSETVVVGPVKLNGTKGVDVPNLMEFGGIRLIERRTRSRTGRRKTAHYRPRPFMRPALEEESPKLPVMMREQLQRQHVRAARRAS